MEQMTTSILIIDDDVAFAKLLERRLRTFISDMSVTHLENLTKAREFVKGGGLSGMSLVFLDQHLPDGRGIELLREGIFGNLAIISVSSDDAPEIPGANVSAGASYFLPKAKIGEPLFQPLVTGVMERNSLQHELARMKLNEAIIDTVRTLVSTLRHEINNPLGAVLGAAYLLKSSGELSKENRDAATLIESSGQRIRHVLEELCKAVEVESVTKANQKVFHIPGDKPWE